MRRNDVFCYLEHKSTAAEGYTKTRIRMRLWTCKTYKNILYNEKEAL
jgi:hypothetical protein